MKAQIFLKTPLYRGAYGAERTPLNANVTEVVGEATSRDGGLDVAVEALYDSRGQPVPVVAARLFLPLAKIDAYVVLNG